MITHRALRAVRGMPERHVATHGREPHALPLAMLIAQLLRTGLGGASRRVP